MKERSIIFKAEMVRAIMDGSKTQTRRIVKFTDSGRIKEPGSQRNWHRDDPDAVLGCPYGQQGDRLWVKEAWAAGFMWDHEPPSKIYHDDGNHCLFYRADGHIFGGCNEGQRGKWRPSIFMPRWASRIDLDMTNVRLERVRDITEEDAVAEGTRQPEGIASDRYWPTYRDGFQSLWDSINLKRGFGWDSNPFVWVIDFKLADTDARESEDR